MSVGQPCVEREQRNLDRKCQRERQEQQRSGRRGDTSACPIFIAFRIATKSNDPTKPV